ncbi:MAG: tyrosine-type recombinase/integrase [Bacteroidales bacterium]|jgi:integrase/recombinase XerC|nr:tyrosine-type recombinase/integrase [Bacteroidales bacterium]MCI2134045.1 tyrosine-type recombinase/integrase [Bacteroidales bacterium]
MNHSAQDYINYISSVRRYSERTQEIYSEVLKDFCEFLTASGFVEGDSADEALVESLTPSVIRSYEVELMTREGDDPRTVNLHLSVLSSFCKYLIKKDLLKSNPVSLVTRPKEEKRLPVFYREESMNEYFAGTEPYASEENASLVTGHDKASMELYSKRLSRLIVSILYSTGIRRSELIALNIGSVDFGRKVLKVRGKGDKMREIPLVPSLCKEISLYLQVVETMDSRERTSDEPLLVTPNGGRLYPVFVDRVIKSELGKVGSITGRKSPHVLRHTLATELLNEGADLNSIKELLGHSSLAATQVYTHNSIEKLKKVYFNAHPRAKEGGNHGD